MNVLRRPRLTATVVSDDTTQFQAVVAIEMHQAVLARVAWAAEHLGTASVASTQGDVLIFEPVPGTPASQGEHQFEPDRTMKLVGECVARLHEQRVEDAPRGESMSERVAALRAGFAPPSEVASAEIEPDPFENALPHPYDRTTPQRLLELLEAATPDSDTNDSPVVCHGDLGLDAIIITEGRTANLAPPVDLTVADRHFDLARLVRSLSQAGPKELIPATIEAYGWDRIHPPRLDWYDMLVALEQ